MTQVSKRVIGKKLESKVYETFWDTIVGIKNNDEASGFFSEFFSKNEKVNFTKRLTITMFLNKGYDWREISDLLKVSLATVGKMAAKIDSKGFKVFFERAEKNTKWKEFWKDMKKAYLLATHGDKVARLGEEGIEKVYSNKK